MDVVSRSEFSAQQLWCAKSTGRAVQCLATASHGWFGTGSKRRASSIAVNTSSCQTFGNKYDNGYAQVKEIIT